MHTAGLRPSIGHAPSPRGMSRAIQRLLLSAFGTSKDLYQQKQSELTAILVNVLV